MSDTNPKVLAMLKNGFRKLIIKRKETTNNNNKKKMQNCSVVSGILYDSKCWTIYSEIKKRLEASEIRFYQ